MEQKVKIGDKIRLRIKRMGINGEGISYYQKTAVFVDFALPNEEVEAIITNVKDNYLIGEIDKLLVKSKDRVTPFCPVYEHCGGCQTQHLAYDAALTEKRSIILQALTRYVGQSIDHKIIKRTIGASEPMNYRNKAILPIRKSGNKTRFGMFRRNSNEFVPIESCPIQNETINQLFKKTVRLIDKHKIAAYNPKTKTGNIRFLAIRISENKKEVQVSFIMFKKHNGLDDLIRDLVAGSKEIVSVMEVINNNVNSNRFFTNKTTLKYGKPYITESLNEQEFCLKPDAFFQLNTKQADKFYLEMKRLANLNKSDIAVDAYAGIAPVSHYIANDCKYVYAIEENKDACESAKLSLVKNGISNVEIMHCSFNQGLRKLGKLKIDVMFFDPPRTGLGLETINQILVFKPKRLIYGSCNPSTLAKDLDLLLKSYDLIELVPIDMFPFTSLVESISLLELKTSL
ncbi:MAG: 23S rRNA (uracil(1939)-C(5))-methyltransferase RlmD [Acholeplasmataceae bacterium]